MSDGRIKPINSRPAEVVRRLSLEPGTEAFLARLFRNLQAATENVEDVSGETLPALPIYLRGCRDTWEIAASIMEWIREPGVFTTEELADEISEPVVGLIRTTLRSTSRAFWAGRDGRDREGDPSTSSGSEDGAGE